MPKTLVALTSSLAFALLAPTAGMASTAAVSGGVLHITANPGETNDISVNTADFGFGPQYAYEDSAGMTAGEGCTQREPTRVTCTGFTRVQADLADGDDGFSTNDSVPDTVNGGSGNDRLNGGAADDTLNGQDGNDTLDGDSENDTLNGGAGDDDLTGDDANDTIDGGPGRDRINGDGPTGFGNGNDLITANDGEADQIDCNFGADSATVDSLDAHANCESVTEAGAGGNGGGTAVSVSFTAPRLLKMARFLGRGITGRLTVSKPAALTIGLVIGAREARRTKLGRKAVLIATDSASVDAGGTYAYSLKVLRKYRTKVARLKALKGTVALIATDSDGKQDSAQRAIALRR